MKRSASTILAFTTASLVGTTGCLFDEEEPAPEPEPPTSTELVSDLCDWSVGDVGITASDVVLTRHGLVGLCEYPGGSQHSLVRYDPDTDRTQSLYGVRDFQVDWMSRVDADTLILDDGASALYVVDLTTERPEPRRLVDYGLNGGEGWIGGPVVIEGEVYYELTRRDGDAARHLVEKVSLAGMDQTPTVVTELPWPAPYLTALDGDLYLFGGASQQRIAAHLALGGEAPQLTVLVDRERGVYEPMDFYGTVGGRVVWQDGDRVHEIVGDTMTEVTLPCRIGNYARAWETMILHAADSDYSECGQLLAQDVATAEVRQAPIDAVGFDDHSVIGVDGDTFYAYKTDHQYTTIVASTLVSR
ncbi:MAG: hypothetical protein R2939_20120 [Kofleriaceae bacterium]